MFGLIILLHWLRKLLSVANLVNPPVVDMDVGDGGWVSLYALYYHEGELYLDGLFVVSDHSTGVADIYVNKLTYGWEVSFPHDHDDVEIKRQNHQLMFPCNVYIGKPLRYAT